MRLRLLLVNPWIYDFAVHNPWSQPLGLHKVAEYLSAFNVDISLIDCTETGTGGVFGVTRLRAEVVSTPSVLDKIPGGYCRYGIAVDDFAGRVRTVAPVDMVLMSSQVTYWYPGVQKAIEVIREVLGDVPVMLGGAYATLCHEHAVANAGADLTCIGPLGLSLSHCISTFGFRLKRIAAAVPYHRLNLLPDRTVAPLLTSTGCPYRCGHCASALLHGRFQQRQPLDVVREIRDLHGRGVTDFGFHDDDLLVEADAHIKPILKMLAASGPRVRLHALNGLHPRFIDDKLARLMKASLFMRIRLTPETEHQPLQTEQGCNVAGDQIARAVEHLKRAGFTKQQLLVDLMYGLPGERLQEVEEGIRLLKGKGVCINLIGFSPIRGTGCWEEFVRTGTITNDLEPLLTNGAVFSPLLCGYDPQSLQQLKLDVKWHNAA